MVFQVKQREAHLQGREEERAEMVRKMHMNGVGSGRAFYEKSEAQRMVRLTATREA